jgi:hypothetical protein
MKRIILILAVLVVSFGGNAQTASLLPEMSEITVDYHLVLSDEERLIYRYSSIYSPFFENKFRVFDVKTGVVENLAAEDIDYEGTTGLVIQSFVKDDLFYELLIFKGRGLGGNIYNGVANRDVKTLKQVGKLVIVDKIEDPIPGAGTFLSLLECDEGFYVLADTKYTNSHYIKRYNYDLEEEWSKELDFLGEEGIEVKKTTYSKNGDVLLAITITEIPKQSYFMFKSQPVKGSGLMFVHIQSDGESSAVSPEFEENLNVKTYDFKYYPNLNELVGVFSVTTVIDDEQNTTAGFGYAHMRWDIEGGLKKSKIYYLTPEDIESPELKKYMELSKMENNLLESENGLKSIFVNANMRFFFEEDGGVVMVQDGFIPVVNGYLATNKLMSESKMIYRVDGDGRLKWANFYPYGSNIGCAFISYSLIEDDKLHMFTAEFVQNFTNDEFNLVTYTERHNWENTIIAERIIDIATGDLDSFKPILKSPVENFVITDIDFGDDEIFFRYNYSRKNKMRLASVKHKTEE